MRFMIIVKARPEWEAEPAPDPDQKVLEEMARYHDELQKAGVLLDASGLKPSSKGWRIRYSGGGRRSVIDGPFTETKELVAGYTLIQVRTREEALEWSRRFPNPVGGDAECEVEVRELYELEDFASSPATLRMRETGLGTGDA